jgi:glucokinase
MPGLRHSDLLEVNEFLVLDFVRDRAETTRPEIEQALGLSAASVSRIVRRLAQADLVSVAKGSGALPGRPRAHVRFNARAGAVVAIDLGGTKCHGALADLGGAVLAEDIRPTMDSGSPYQTLITSLGVLRTEADRRELPLLAVAVGVPAVVEPETGLATQAPNVHWEGFEIVPRLRAAVDVPVTVDNDVNLAAMGHAWRGDGRNSHDFVTISIGTGIGAGVVVGGQLLKGRHNAAGEIGGLVVGLPELQGSYRGNLGAFEQVASGPAIARRAAELLADPTSGPSLLRENPVSPEAVFGAALQGDRIANQIVDDTLDHIAVALVAITTIVDPERIILDGGVGRSLEPYLASLNERLARHLTNPPELRVSRLGPNATVVGAIAAALQLTRQAPTATPYADAFSVNGL